MGKVKGKHRLDKYYRLAKERGFRSRASYKLLQLDEKHSFLHKTQALALGSNFVLDLVEVKPFKHYMKDGWGLATDGEVLFGSDGTSTLYQMDPRTMKVTDKHTVRYNGREVRYLNELEYINKEVWANVWQSDCIARISPKDGSLLGWILLPKLRQGLLKSGHEGIDVLNGIAWDSKKQRLFVTGKLWPKLYQIKLKPASEKSEKQIERQCLV